jgi:microcin C transport system substrate-binding protein
MTEGVPQFRLIYKGTTVKAIAPFTVRIELGEPGKENMLSLFSLPVMPEKFWKIINSATRYLPAAGSGLIASPTWRMGQYVTYSRVKDYWGRPAGQPRALEFRHPSL